MTTAHVNNNNGRSNTDTNVKQCPCQSFQTAQDIRRALDSDERTSLLVEWLSSSKNKNDGRRLSCQTASTNNGCTQRVSSAFIILNAIRDACRHHLESSVPEDKTEATPQTYDEAFPSLVGGNASLAAAPTVLIARKKDKTATQSLRKEKPKSKRRIRPAPATEGPAATSVWSSSNVKGNISALPSETPLNLRETGPAFKGISVTKPETTSKKSVKRIAPTPLAPSAATVSVQSPWPVARTANESVSNPFFKGTQTARNNGYSNAPTSLAHPSAENAATRSAWPVASTTSTNMPIPSSRGSKNARNIEDYNGPTHLAHQTTENATARSAWPVVSTANEKNMFNPSPKGSNDSKNDGAICEVKASTVTAAGTTRSLNGLHGKCDAEQPILQEVIGLKASNAASTMENAKINRESMEKQLRNLVQVYTTILQRHLVPSTALELHLLLRLLTVKDDSTVPAHEINSDLFSSLFTTGKECQTFAVLVLRRMKSVLRNLGFDLVKSLAECPPFREMLPDIAKDLHSIAESMRHDALLFGIDSVSNSVGSIQTPMLTLPFDQERDSRHNYRSREASGLYKNREESRDAFLYQLRAFQNVRERVLDAVHADRSLQKIRIASRDVVHGIFAANMLWFAQMFCDLLLQIGLVPMEETDKDILNITDKDKLQKLHRRFSSKQGKTNKSSHKLSLEPKNPMEPPSASGAQPQQLFPGHQEFFFIFIQSADSYSFGVHLKRRLAGMLSKFAVVDDAKGLAQRLLNMQLLARFLGALVFSPNWHEFRQSSPGWNHLIPALPSEDAVSLLNLVQPVLPFGRYIETAWKERRLVEVVPWVVEFLRMLRWDSLSQNTSYYRQLFALLWAIQEGNGDEDSDAFSAVHSNLQLVSFYLESLFCNVVGLGRRSVLPNIELPEQNSLSGMENDQGDASLLVFGKTLLFASNSHLEELLALIKTFKESKQKSATDVGVSPRKMRPHVLKGSIHGISSLSFSEAYDSEMSGVTDKEVTKPTFDNPSASREDGCVAIQRKLADAFFHQHKDLKELCDFAVDRILKNMQLLLPEQCIIPTIEKGLSSSLDVSKASLTKSESFLNALNRVAQDALVESRSALRVALEDEIGKTLTLLGPPSAHRKVTEVAASLAVSHAVRLGETVILALVREEVKKKRDAEEKIEKQRPIATDGENEAQQQTPLETAIDSLNRFAGALIDHNNLKVEASKLLELALEAKNGLDSWLSSLENSASEQASRPLDSPVTKLDPCGPCIVFLLESCFTRSSVSGKVRWSLAFEVLALAVLLARARFCHRVLENIMNLFRREGQLERLVALGIESRTTSTDASSVGKVLVDMVNAKLIDENRLERALDIAVNDLDGQLVTKVLEQLRKQFNTVAGSQTTRNRK